jgi:hypothetical protein
LVAAAEEGCSEIILTLLEHGANINLENELYGPPVIAAAFSGRTEAALLLLQHGADSSSASKWWQHRLNTREGKDAVEIPIPKYLKWWEKASLGQDYRTINALMDEISSTTLDRSFDSLVWEWELPVIMESNNLGEDNDCKSRWTSAEHVIFVSSDGITSSYEPTKHIEATTCLEYLTRRWKYPWSDFMLELINLVNVAELNATDSGMFVGLSRSPLIAVTQLDY